MAKLDGHVSTHGGEHSRGAQGLTAVVILVDASVLLAAAEDLDDRNHSDSVITASVRRAAGNA